VGPQKAFKRKLLDINIDVVKQSVGVAVNLHFLSFLGKHPVKGPWRGAYVRLPFGDRHGTAVRIRLCSLLSFWPLRIAR
jgi:hypothetical protein